MSLGCERHAAAGTHNDSKRHLIMRLLLAVRLVDGFMVDDRQSVMVDVKRWQIDAEFGFGYRR